MVTKVVEKEIVALVQKKENETFQSGKNQGKIYLSYLLADPQTGEETWYKQFNEVSAGEPVQIGEVWRFKVSEKPANNGTIFHNVEKVLGKAGTATATVTDVAGEDVVVDTPPTNPTPPKPPNPKPPAQPDMPGVYNRERSIERQVSVKSGVDLLTIRAGILRLVWETMPGEFPDEVDPRYAVAENMWTWITQTGKPTDWANALATWMQS